MRRAKKSKREPRNLRYDPNISGIHGKIFKLKRDLTYLCECYVQGATGVVVHSYRNGTSKVCFECLHTSTLPNSEIVVSKFQKRFTRRPKRPSRPIFPDEPIIGSRLLRKKKFKLLPKKKSRLVLK